MTEKKSIDIILTFKNKNTIAAIEGAQRAFKDLKRMGRTFFPHFLCTASTEDSLEEAFALTYNMKGMTYSDVERMSTVDRRWFLKRLLKQMKKSEEANNPIKLKAII